MQGKIGAPPARVSVSGLFASLIVLLLLLLSLVTALLVWREYHLTLSQGDERANNAARIAAEHARWLIGASMTVLNRVDEELGEGTDWWHPPTGQDTNRFPGLAPEGTRIWVTDAAGITTLTTRPDNPRVDLSDRDYFMALAQGEQTHISRLLTGRMSGEKIFVVARRIERDGAFAGVAAAHVPVHVLAPFWLSLGIGPGSSVGLINDEGWQVARHPVPDEAGNFTDHVLFTEHLPRADSGHYRSPASPIDAVARIVGYHRVPGLPLVALVGIPEDAVLAGFRRSTYIFLGFAIPLLLLLAAMSAWGLNWLRRDERTRAELAQALEQNRLLIREIHHRVKNNLQVVAALVTLQPGSPEAKAEMRRRIAAMAASHEHIYRGEQFDRVDLSEHLPTLVEGLRESYGAATDIDYDLEPLSLPSDLLLPFALIASEVVGNAFKHAFSDGRQGRVTVTLRRRGSGRATLCIADNGKGMDPARESRGLGMKLLRAFSQQLGGEYAFEPAADGGTRFVLDFPLTAGDHPGTLPGAERPDIGAIA